jgi:two-component system cell cycle sensor histidine kinase/response regulator CckA
LVVDDEESVRRFILAVLQTQGFLTLEATDGKNGHTRFLAHAEEVDLILTDIVMPNPGPLMVEQILHVRPSVAVGFISGTAALVELPDHLKGFPVLEKPFTASALLRFVRACLDATGGRSPE